MSTPEQCARGDCDRPAERRGLCRMHYDRERGPRHRHREDREAAKVQVATEHAELLKVAKAMGAEPTGDRQVVRLRPGPPTRDEDDISERITTPSTCDRCETYHQRGHACPVCGTKPHVFGGYRWRGAG